MDHANTFQKEAEVAIYLVLHKVDFRVNNITRNTETQS